MLTIRRERPHIWVSAQNLNDKHRHWSHARAWLHVSYDDARGTTACASWCLPTRDWGGYVEIGGEECDFMIGLHVWPVLSLYLSIQGVVDKRQHPRWWTTRQYGLRIHQAFVSLDWGSDPWRESLQGHCTLNWKRLLFGQRHSTEESRGYPGQHTLAMPEGAYPCKVRLYRRWWWYDRLPFRWQVNRVDVDLEANPVPHPGKGENSWDLGDDATHSMSLPADTVEQALACVRESIMERRERYGGSDWRPEPPNTTS